MFGFNTGIMLGLKSFCEFNSLRKNQLLRFYEELAPLIRGCGRGVVGVGGGVGSGGGRLCVEFQKDKVKLDETHVGKRVSVYWPKDRKSYAGVLAEFDKESGKHTVRYDDGDTKQYDMAKRQFVFEGETEGESKQEGKQEGAGGGVSPHFAGGREGRGGTFERTSTATTTSCPSSKWASRSSWTCITTRTSSTKARWGAAGKRSRRWCSA